MGGVFKQGKEVEKFSANAEMKSSMTKYPVPKENATATKGRTPTKRNFYFGNTAGFKTPSGNGVVKSRRSDKLKKEMGNLNGVVKLTKSIWDSFSKIKAIFCVLRFTKREMDQIFGEILPRGRSKVRLGL
jgi:hypothetical protein